ncbi:MAG: hypothetical protein ACI4MG_08540 [Aristaeellaceae bacterium]
MQKEQGTDMEQDYGARMTTLSSAAYAAATADGLSSQSAADVLMEQVQIRSFRDMLTAYADAGSLRGLLVEGLCANDSSRVRESVDKKVRGWLSGKYQPTRREDFMELCFILHLDAGKADAFLAASSDAGLHWREPRELVYAYALDRGMTYPEAVALYNRVQPGQVADDSMVKSFTPLIHQEAQRCRTEDELREYLRSAAGKLGKLHNTAYQHFMAMMKVLEEPESLAGQEEGRYTTREIVEKYLDRKLPTAREGKALEEKKRCVLADWPDEVTLSRMKNRKADVTRKVLMLLFLATDDGDGTGDEWQDDEAYDEEDWPGEESGDAAFRSTRLRMNQMLADCGFRQLDPRNAFDWLVLYCMRSSADTETMDGLNEQLSHVLEMLFTAARPEA